MGAGLVDRIGWTLLDFTWQGAVIGLHTAIALAALRNARPQLRYTVACIGLLLCLLWPVAGLFNRFNGGPDDSTGVAILMGADLAGVVQSEGWSTLFARNLATIVAAWSLCALLFALRMASGLLWIRRAAGVETRDPAWQARLDWMASGLGVTRAVGLRLVAHLSSPVTAGWWRPVVLVPASLVTTMPPHLLEALLAHELAHVQRHDYLVNLLQNVIEALLFYHPAVWWLSRRIRVERELIADDIAATQLGEPRRLALALSELEKLQFSTHHLAQAANGGILMQRIKRLLGADTQAVNWKAALPVIGFALAGLIGCAQQPREAITAPGMSIQANVLETAAVADFTSCSRPVYPANALQRKIEGTVSLGFLVGKDGSVRETTLRSSSGDTSLDDAARLALAKCSFKPATINGAPIEKWTEVQYVWKAG